MEEDKLGYRVHAANVMGGDKEEIMVMSLGFPATRRTLRIYNGDHLDHPPVLFELPQDVSNHWPQGPSSAQLSSNEPEELVIGDSHYQNNRGRVVIFYIDR